MGSITDMKIAMWQERAGLTPATPKRAGALDRLQAIAVDLIKVCELEKSGIRDGDGHWYGCDPVAELIWQIGCFKLPPTDEADEPECKASPLPDDGETLQF